MTHKWWHCFTNFTFSFTSFFPSFFLSRVKLAVGVSRVIKILSKNSCTKTIQCKVKHTHMHTQTNSMYDFAVTLQQILLTTICLKWSFVWSKKGFSWHNLIKTCRCIRSRGRNLNKTCRSVRSRLRQQRTHSKTYDGRYSLGWKHWVQGRVAG